VPARSQAGHRPDAARPASNRTVIIEFLVDDVDGVHQNLAGFVEDFVQEPTTMPWGNRSLLFRDPDGNLVNFFTPVTPAARGYPSVQTSITSASTQSVRASDGIAGTSLLPGPNLI
jgi:hypothetical protein